MNKEALRRLMYYMTEREKIRAKKDRGEQRPWSKDEILNTYRFTNVKRIDDRTTKEFAKLYRANKLAPPEQALFNCASMRWHGTISWANFAGWMTNTRSLPKLHKEAGKAGVQIFTGAYVITNGGSREAKTTYVEHVMNEVAKAAPGIVAALEQSLLWEAGFRALQKVEGHGASGFMAKEVLQDYLIWREAANYAQVNDNYSWSPAGPGARRGLARVLDQKLPTVQNHRHKGAEIALGEITLWLRHHWKHPLAATLSAHDVQFCLCEFDKYERARLKQGKLKRFYTPFGG